MTKDKGSIGINIYLAGKVSANDWRHKIVDALRDTCCEFGCNGLPDRWPVLWNGIAPNRHYVGPYFVGCDHGCYHGKDSHGYGPGCSGNDMDYPGVTCDNHCQNSAREEYIINQCSEAILKSDIVFAWIDDLTAFGTIFELGIATGNKKRVVLALPNDFEKLLTVVPYVDARGETVNRYINNLWFMVKYIEMQATGRIIFADDGPVGAFNRLLNQLDKEEIEEAKRALIESPIEKQFYDACSGYCYGDDLVPQYEIIADNHRYRADFAIPSLKIVIELDGHEYHKTKEQRTNDARRERDLQNIGWRVIRFTGTEINADVYKCAEDACKFIDMVKA